MKFSLDLRQRSISWLSDAIKIYLPTCLFIVVVWLIAEACGIGMYELTADPAEVARKPPYTGLFSNLGNLLWSGTVAICIFTAFLIKVDQASGRRWLTFLIASSFLTAFLLLDDLFQVHEYYPVLFFGFNTKIPLENRTLQNLFEAIFFVIYFACFGLYLFYFRYHIRQTEYLSFILAIFFFGLSIVVDMAPETLPGHYIIEESFKLLGIISWITYFSRTCSSIIRQLMAKVSLHLDKVSSDI
ncbi:MAG TPA: hypothetical protein V6C91_19290 [Coleofasciculaceae cyanobacterium]